MSQSPDFAVLLARGPSRVLPATACGILQGMSKPLAAIDFLAQRADDAVPPVGVLFGNDAFLKRQVLLRLRQTVLDSEDAEFSYASFPGDTALLKDVLGELTTVALFGGGRRLAVVDDADGFVTRYRGELEDYVARPSRNGVLVLLLETFPSNTRLYKAVAAAGLLVDCSVPAESQLGKWLVSWAQHVHKVRLPRDAADMLVEIIGAELGLLDQELAKLALVAGNDRAITPESISQMVAGWRTKTTWDMLDAALAGNIDGALGQLDRLLSSGETPVGLLAQVAASLRRLAAATRLVLDAEQAGRRIALREALERAGVRSFIVPKVEPQLKRLGRQRGAQLYRWLLDADLDLKGESQLPPRLVLERLIVRLSHAPDAAPASRR